MIILPRPGLVDLVAGVLPVSSGWFLTPTDSGDITDGDSVTTCTTGNKVTSGAWESCYLTWDLGAFYDVLLGATGHCDTTAGSGYLKLSTRVAAGWSSSNTLNSSNWDSVSTSFVSRCDQVRLELTSNVAATISPHIREFHVLRL